MESASAILEVERRIDTIRSPVLLAYSGTIALGAFLLFWVQPLFTKQALPLLGGSPGVWNTALVFFQGTLLGGYLYAHLLSKANVRLQVFVHLAMAAAAFAVLPFGIPEGWIPSTHGEPSLSILGLFAIAIGLPFFVVSATSPLLQRWFARTDLPSSDDPYFLYSASNLGSMGALLAFPLLLEPWIGLEEQARLWRWAFAGLLVVLALCGLEMLRVRTISSDERGAVRGAQPAVPWRGIGKPGPVDRLWWCALAFAPSSLLLGVTTHITTEVAAVPLFWVVPLLLYLATFAIVFARRPLLPHTWMVRSQPHAVILLLLALLFSLQLYVSITIHLLGFFLIAMVCHGELVRRRPSPQHLTEFYLWMSIGGVLGGAFNALAAPQLFDSVLEYPLLIAAACALRPVLDGSGERVRQADLIFPGLLFLGLAVAGLAASLAIDGRPPRALYLVVFLAAALVAFSFRKRPVRLALGIGALLITLPATFGVTGGTLLARERSFFGVHMVRADGSGQYHLLYHGATLHGVQAVDPDRRTEPLAYYVPESPVADVLTNTPNHRIGVIGLGAGALACYRESEQEWTFFEIDPVVVRIATDSEHFDFLARCTPNAEVVLGDGRLSLRGWAGAPFDIMIVDAFSSASIPVHLLTIEAIELYFSHLAPDGVVALHVSNRHLMLAPVLAAAVRELGLVGRYWHYRPERREDVPFQAGSQWVVLAEREGTLDAALRSEQWEQLVAPDGRRPWTDDFSNILSALR